MKMLLVVLLLSVVGSSAQAIEPNSVNRSSAIVAATSTGYIPALYLDKVIVGNVSTSGVLEIYNSSAITNTSVLMSSISLASVRYVDFSNTLVAGVVWKTSSNTNGVTILYKK